MDRSSYSLFLCSDPERFASPPLWLHAPGGVRVVKILLQKRIPKGIADNAMTFRVKASDQSEMVRKRDTGKAW